MKTIEYGQMLAFLVPCSSRNKRSKDLECTLTREARGIETSGMLVFPCKPRKGKPKDVGPPAHIAHILSPGW